MNLSDLVKDWGGFELLVAELNKTGDVTVEHDVTLVGKSGAGRQIDVLIRHKQGLYEHLIIVECKFWNSAVDRATIDSLAQTVREVGASRGVVFSTQSFQSGAITQAKYDNIDLFRVRELTDEEWGLPGKIIDLYLHVIAVSVGGISFERTFTLPGHAPLNPNLNIHLGDASRTSRTPIEWAGSTATTLEEGIEKACHQAAQKTYVSIPFICNGSYDAKLRARIQVNIEPVRPIVAKVNGGSIWIPRATIDVGISISQSRLLIDRSQKLAFALAVEDCVRRTVTAASRIADAGTTILTPLDNSGNLQVEETVRNGSVASAWMGGVYSFDKFSDLSPGEIRIEPATDESPRVL